MNRVAELTWPTAVGSGALFGVITCDSKSIMLGFVMFDDDLLQRARDYDESVRRFYNLGDINEGNCERP